MKRTFTILLAAALLGLPALAQTAAGNVGCAQIGEKTPSSRTASRCPFCGADLDAKNADECPNCKAKFVAENKPNERKEDN